MPKNKKTVFFIAAALSLLSTGTGLAADYVPSSVLASGQWVKVHVDSTSVYRIDYRSLREWGFTEPEKVRVFGYGSVEQAHLLDTAPDDLPPVGVRHSGDALYFYGEGDDRTTPSTSSGLTSYRNFYSRGSNYFLTASLPGTVIADAPETEQGTPSSTHISIDRRLPEDLNIHSASVFFFSHDLASRPEGLSYTFRAPDFVENGYLAYRYTYLHGEDDAQYVSVEFSGDVTPASFTPTTHRRNVVDNRLYSLASLKKIPIISASENPFTVRFSIPSDCHFDRLAFSEIYWMYSRKNLFRGPVMDMHFLPSATSPLTVSLSNLPQDIEIWNVSDPRSVSRLRPQASERGDAIVTITPGQTSVRRLCIFTPGPQIPQPEFAGQVFCRNLHSISSADYLIVTTEDLLPEAERLAATHREKQGLQVAVVTQNEVFNEFSSGSPHPNALRKFVRMLYERPDRPLRYLLLLGCPTYDPRHNLSDDGTEHLVGYEVERSDQAASEATDHATDLYFGMMADRIPENLGASYNEVSVSVGRAPVLTADEARIFVDKCVAYLNDPRVAGRPDLAVLVACEGDNDAHLNGSEKLRSDILKLAPFTTCARIYNALYPFDKKLDNRPTFAPLTSQVARGPFLLNYTGHSGHFEIGSILTVSHISRMTFTSMPILYLSSCETTPIDASFRGIGTQFLLHPTGPVAVIGSGRSVYLSNNHAINEEFTRQLVSPDGPERLGDVWRSAVNNTAKYGSVQRINNYCYNFLSDPALPVRRPDRKVVADFESETDGSPINAAALSPLNLNGRITLDDGSTDTDFNGSLLLSLYDAPRITQRYVHSKGDSDTIMQLDESLLLQTSVEVRNGKWNATVTPPLSSHRGRNRMTMLAYSADGHIACGMDSTLTVSNPGSEILLDTTAPLIDCYLNSPEVPDGAEIGPEPVLYATIRDDESGIANGSANIGDMPSAVLDSSTRLPNIGAALSFNTDGSAELRYPVGKLGDGRHTLTLSARDVAGNTARKTLTFTIVSNPLTAVLSCDSTFVRESVEFLLISPATMSGLSARLLIRDSKGHTIFSQPDTAFPFAYDFRDSQGAPLPDGTYHASVILTDGLRHGSSQGIEVTLLRPRY